MTIEDKKKDSVKYMLISRDNRVTHTFNDLDEAVHSFKKLEHYDTLVKITTEVILTKKG